MASRDGGGEQTQLDPSHRLVGRTPWGVASWGWLTGLELRIKGPRPEKSSRDSKDFDQEGWNTGKSPRKRVKERVQLLPVLVKTSGSHCRNPSKAAGGHRAQERGRPLQPH